MTFASDAGGLSRYIVDLSLAMRARGHEVAIAGDTGAWQWLFDQHQLEYIHVPYKAGPLGMLSAVRRISKWAKHRWGTAAQGGGIDLFHSHYRRPTIAARILQRTGHPAPILYTLHLSHINLAWGQRLLTDFGDHTHVASSDALHWLTHDARVPPSKATVIPHGVMVEKWPVTTDTDRAAARKELHLEPTDRVAAHVGRLDYPKNCAWLLDLAQQWKQQRRDSPPLKLLMAGEGPEFTDLQSRIHREGLTDSVHLLGHRDPLRIYQASDLLLLASLREGFSLVCAEAMATGLPVLRTQTSGTSELILPNQTGFSTPINHDAFIQAAISALSNEPQLRQMRPACAQHIRSHLTFEKQVEATTALYERLVGKGNGTTDEHRECAARFVQVR
jgi:glycosyltransferase involved in cell wall biosynthesis